MARWVMTCADARVFIRMVARSRFGLFECGFSGWLKLPSSDSTLTPMPLQEATASPPAATKKFKRGDSISPQISHDEMSPIDSGLHFPRLMNAILTELYPALVKQSAALLAQQPGHPLQPQDLLHMALERILRHPPAEEMQTERILRGLVTAVMRRVLVDEWRRRTANRRGRGIPTVPLHEATGLAVQERESWPDLDEALALLRCASPECAEVVEMRFFQGVPQRTLARSLAVSPTTMSRRWGTAAAWLRRALTDHACRQSSLTPA